MSRLEQALNRTDGERLAQHQHPEIELEPRRSVVRDARLDRHATPTYDYDPDARSRGRGRDGPGLETLRISTAWATRCALDAPPMVTGSAANDLLRPKSH